jgi:hypothetical protein
MFKCGMVRKGVQKKQAVLKGKRTSRKNGVPTIEDQLLVN